MITRSVRDPSPVRSGFIHGSLGALSLVLMFGGGGGLLHLFGDADAAGPRVHVALFEPAEGDKPELKKRLPEEDVGGSALFASTTQGEAQARSKSGAGPDLGVEYSAAEGTYKVAASQTETVRINGRDIPLGQSYSQVKASTIEAAPLIQASVATPEPEQARAAPAPLKDTPFKKYAAKFDNPEGKPTVSIIVGGLGINWRHTEAAIKELPPEVTLSFSPGARNLHRYVREARALGHEVLIELPMEPYDYGRDRPHPNILQVNAGADANTARLKRLLSQVRGFAGVTNYQGARFATSAEATEPVFRTLAETGLAFFEDGSLSKSVFADTAKETKLTFAAADAVLDARPEADEIEKQLLALEAEALENGHSLGSGFAYPVTIDIITAWAGRLEQRGILLAPASYRAKQQSAAGQIEVAALDQAG